MLRRLVTRPFHFRLFSSSSCICACRQSFRPISLSARSISPSSSSSSASMSASASASTPSTSSTTPSPSPSPSPVPVPVPVPVTDDPRLGNLLRTLPFDEIVPAIEAYKKQHTNGSRHPPVVILGFGYDVGCQRNGGRVGAADGPEAVRKQLPRMGSLINPEWSANLTNLCLLDGGDVASGLTLEEAHSALEARVTAVVKAGGIPFVIGGSNDQSYPNACGMIRGITSSEEKQPVFGVVNIDAHLDVRPRKEGLVHSGSPFRELLEDARFKDTGKFVEFAAQGNQCSQAHADYVIKSGHDIIWLSTIQNHKDNIMLQFHRVLESLGDHIFVSFDIDSIQSSDCPGVSCPATIGLSSRDALEICYIAGQDQRVRMMDISEFNPKIEDYRTSRLVVNMLYWFLMGLSTRKTTS